MKTMDELYDEWCAKKPVLRFSVGVIEAEKILTRSAMVFGFAAGRASVNIEAAEEVERKQRGVG